MKKLPYRSFLPKLFIALGLLFWLKTGIFQYFKTINDAEIQNRWSSVFQKKNKRMALQNLKDREITDFNIIKRPDDKPILDGMDSILVLQNKTIAELKKERAKDEIDILAIEYLLKTFKSNAAGILSKTALASPIMREEEVESVMKNGFEYSSGWFTIKDKPYLFGWLENYVYQGGLVVNDYFLSKTGGAIYCCGAAVVGLQFLKSLKIGETSEGVVSLDDSCPREEMTSTIYTTYPSEIKINGKRHLLQSGVASLDMVFQDTVPKRFEVTAEWYNYTFEGEKIRKDTIVRSGIFVVRPSKGEN